MAELVFNSSSVEDNLAIASQILSVCKGAKVFALLGNLGAGKTTFVKSLCQVLGSKDEVSSPTFALIQEYECPEGLIYHFDFYRLKSEDEAYELGYPEYFDSGEYCFVEWAEKLPHLLPSDCVVLKFETLSNGDRRIQLSY